MHSQYWISASSLLCTTRHCSEWAEQPSTYLYRIEPLLQICVKTESWFSVTYRGGGGGGGPRGSSNCGFWEFDHLFKKAIKGYWIFDKGENGQWLEVSQCLYLRGPNANPVSGIANCRVASSNIYSTLYQEYWATTAGIIDSGQYWHSGQPHLNRKLNFMLIIMQLGEIDHQYIDMSDGVLSLESSPPQDFILTCAFPRGAMIGAIGCIWYLLS